ncbi:Na(+)-translocating NADH-quinone reductase subunit A [Neolewinella antarctica]|uniref:Na(+)-translocating NADH-quinone reductase subunit A n=1 Tax=Neolewinella antarctica TaxID=442734 RepID=A0ABX0XEU9_9BACT|nr:Na(+)-translocating NADH-quinone reductase subunit A [Neolewinella antarctica]NJC27272.1 Na+-transporting NADH:ubiquinone oxidoreductase subunit A [Neolewinella antarctica]
MKITRQTLQRSLLLLVGGVGLQSQASASGNNLLIYSIAAVALLLLFFIIISVADNFMVLDLGDKKIDKSKVNMGLYPRMSELFGKRRPEYLEGENYHKLTRGYDIPLEGAPAATIDVQTKATRFAIMPPDFDGLMPIPKVTVEEGDAVKAGDVVFYDKKKDRIKFVAPVSGEVLEVKRGLKRSIDSIIILADKEQVSREYELPSPHAERSELVDFLLESGVWPSIRQRPFNTVADPELTPRDIFVTTFSTAPLAYDSKLSIAGREEEFQLGINILNRLTDGLVYLGLDGREDGPTAYGRVANAQKHYFEGPHPAGNVGIQAHHIHPIGNAQDTCWTMDVNGVLTLGTLFLKGKYDTSRVIALTGAEMADPRHVRTYAGANIGELYAGTNFENVRAISGDVLTGHKVGFDGFLGFFDTQVTVIEEGNEPEIFGWLLPIKPRASISRTIPTFGKLAPTTNSHGERRAFVVNNDYERVMPMDVYLTQLMKTIMISDFEAMEGLGIYELVEEDVALAEFACVSKQPLQYILRDGLRLMQQQG